MNIVELTPPGRLPTVVFDPGLWWNLVNHDDHHVVRFSANYAWWKTICSPSLFHIVSEILPEAYHQQMQKILARAEPLPYVLSEQATYQSKEAYTKAIFNFESLLHIINNIQEEIHINLTGDILVNELNYRKSADMLAFALADTFLSKTIALACNEAPRKIDVLLVTIKSVEDLLTAMITINVLKKERPDMYVCLIDHGYENFSLHPHLEKLKESNTLLRIFDSIICSKEDRDFVVSALIDELSLGNRLQSFISKESFASSEASSKPSSEFIPEPLPTFTSEPVYWTRVSSRRCYWSKCTFCTQNSKYNNPLPPSRAEIEPSLDRIASLIQAGYRTFIFSDEAISPAFLKSFCSGVIERGLKFRWACRSKLELMHTAELFNQLKLAGCYEVLFGLETIVPRVQKLMDKYVEGLDDTKVKQIFQAAHQAGVGLHINLIGGFPGETPSELKQSVEFLSDALKDVNSATILLNKFTLFPDTPVSDFPERFGLNPIYEEGDIHSNYAFTYAPELLENSQEMGKEFPNLYHQLHMELGWLNHSINSQVNTAFLLYFASGHGSIFKTQQENIFNRPLINI